MQVSQLVELDTHVVIGGGKARSFSMSDSAEFFTVLSDTLYRDKKRAVVREVICNGWDAHVMNDCTDRPLEITLTNDEMVIKDFGPGISDDRIVPIYCVYGASTKVKDETQTGGFGLGSKAPFAYTDHFTVTSCFEGKKIVYAISRGGSATDGKPEIRQMVAIPTEESGITVTIPLRDKSDRNDFDRTIRSVVRQGGIKALLNGVELNAYDYEPARANGFCAVPNSGDMHESIVYLLYGTVLYPVTTTDKDITSAVNSVRAYIPHESHRLVLIAPPNSIGVTPSRESLSYSELTTGTILRLLKRATNLLRNEQTRVAKKIITEVSSKASPKEITEYGIRRLMMKYVPKISSQEVLATAERICMMDLADSIDSISLPKRSKWIYAGMKQAHPDMRAHFRASIWRKKLIGESLATYEYRRFVAMAQRAGLSNDAVIYNDYHTYTGSARMLPAKFYEADRIDFDSVIFVGPNKRELTSMIVGTKSDPTYRTRRLYRGLVVGAKPSKALLERIRELAEKFGFTVREFNFEKEKPKIVRVKRPAELYHRLADYMDDKKLVEPTLAKPKFFMRAYINAETMRVGIDNTGVRHMLNNLFPDTAVITTKVQEEKLRKAGVRNVIEVVGERLVKLGRSREVQYGIMVLDRLFVETPDVRYASELGRTALTLAKMHPDIARIIFPDRVKLGEVWKEAKQIIAIVRDFPFHLQDLPMENHPFHTLNGIVDTAKKTFEPIIVPQSRCARHFRYLSVLVGSDWLDTMGTLNERDRTELINVIRYLQRLNDKSKLTSRKNVIAQKEAA